MIHEIGKIHGDVDVGDSSFRTDTTTQSAPTHGRYSSRGSKTMATTHISIEDSRKGTLNWIYKRTDTDSNSHFRSIDGSIRGMRVGATTSSMAVTLFVDRNRWDMTAEGTPVIGGNSIAIVSACLYFN